MMTTPAHTQEFPLRIGSPEDFARVGSSLRDAGFDEMTVCRTLKIAEMSDVGSIKAEEADFGGISERLALFIKLFLFLRLMPRAEVERLLDRATLDSFLTLGILRIGEYGADQYYTPVLLYPVAGFLIVSDRHSNPDRSEFVPPPDVVFPAIYAGTLRFLRLISKSPAEDVLDLGAGTGIGAFVLSRHARRAVASDLTERATHFARFNRLLNKLENVEVVCGDLYGSVEGRSFDRIIAHPPYVPALKSAAIWRDGGETGEVLVRRIIEGLPRHLRPGGTLYMVCMGLDTSEAKFEERARSWLKDSQSEFDVIFALGEERSPQEVIRAVAEKYQNLEPADAARLEQAFDRADAVKLSYGALAMHRRARGGEPWTTRTRLSDETEGSDLEWALDWHRRCERPGFQEELLQARPQLAPHLEVKVTHVVHEGSLVPADFVFETNKPFTAATRFDPWMVPLITRFDGASTPLELYEAARAASEIPEAYGLKDFTALVIFLIERGYLLLR
ncbi:MAG TPA: methyltransferase [Pyrinomonadaceae bacterium]|nr:methyltransferase [Pyrinomonadaceae bacterium]